MKKIFLLCFLFFTLTAKGQQGFIKSYNFNYPTATVFNTMILDESELIICGYIRDTISPYQQGIFLTKLDTLGNVLNYSIHYDSLGYNYAAGAYPGGLLKLDDDSGYVFTGSVVEAGGSGFLSKWDLDGNFVWLKILEDFISWQGYYNSLIETQTGFLIGGHKQLPNTSTNDIFLLKTDKQGNVLWEQQYGQSTNGDLLSSFIEINNNEYVLGGLRGAGGNLSATQVQIFAVDSLGQQKWYWESNTPPVSGTVPNRGCFGLHHDTLTGNWIYATVHVVEEAFGVYYQVGQFVVRDSNFNLITEREYDDVDGDENRFYNLVQLSDGDWLGVGVNRELVENPTQALSHRYGHLARISNGNDGLSNVGDTLWTRSDLIFPDTAASQQIFFHSAVELPSGNIIAAGYFTGFGYTDHGLLIKINQHGCLDYDNCPPTNFPNVTSIALTTCDSTAVGTEEFIYPNQNGEDSIVIVTTTLIPLPETPDLPAEIMIEENAAPFNLNISEIINATEYEWTVPAGVQILSGADSTTVVLDWSGWNMDGQVCVSAGNACGSSPIACMEVTVDVIDGLSELAKKGYRIFPNPTDEMLHIIFEDDGLYEIVWLDVLGREVIAPAFYTGTAVIITTKLQVGIYWLKMIKEGVVFWEQVEVIK